MPRAGLTPAKVVAEASELADLLGYEGLTLSALASRCGVAVPSLYKHVGGLDDLRRQVAIAAVHGFGDEVSRATEGVTGDDAVRALATAFRRYATEHPGRYAATVRAPDPDDAEHLAATQAVLDTVLSVLAGYDLTGDDAVDAARGVRAALHGFVALEAAGGFGLPRDVDRSYERLVTALVAALDGWSRTEHPGAPGSGDARV